MTLDVVLGFFLKLEEDTCCNSEKGKEILKFRFRHCEATWTLLEKGKNTTNKKI